MQNGFGLPGNPPVQLPKQVRCMGRVVAPGRRQHGGKSADNDAAHLVEPLLRAQCSLLPVFSGRTPAPLLAMVLQVSHAAWDMIVEYCSFHAVPGRSDKVTPISCRSRRTAAAPACTGPCRLQPSCCRRPRTRCMPRSLLMPLLAPLQAIVAPSACL